MESNTLFVIHAPADDNRQDDTLEEMVRELGSTTPFFPRVWLVQSELSGEQAFEELKPRLPPMEQILVVDCNTGDYYCWPMRAGSTPQATSS